jgi:ribosomal protein S2
MAVVTMRQLLESGVHFGHQTRRWNPKMKRFIMTERNGIYIIDLQQSLAYIDRSYAFVKETVAKGGVVMFVGTKKQAQEAIAEQATRVGMPYVNQRWLGGMLTNFQTVHQRINRLKELDEVDFDNVAGSGRTKKELLQMKRERDKLDKTLGGIREMTRTPAAVWIVDTNKEHLAVEEARKLRIPIIGILDSNCDPDLVDFPIPGNDDAIRAVGMPYVNQRWLGGMLTNFQTVHQRINRLKELDEIDFDDVAGSGRTKKELLHMKREQVKLDKTLGGIRDMTRTPSAVWIVDTNKEHLAVEEARKLRIPIIGILDSNCDPDVVDFPIPGNDDAIRAVSLLTRVVADAVADGLMARSGAKSTDEAGAELGSEEPLAEWERELLEGQADKVAVEATGGDATTTDAPASEATGASTEAAAAEAPATEAPATETPATEAPATEASATEAPATEAPAAEAPAAEGETQA